MSTQNQLTGVCGEHYVAARLAGMGYLIGLPRGGSPVVDLMVSSSDGKRSINVQVKTAQSAWRPTKGKKHWEWPMGWTAEESCSDTLIYAFVDLRNWPSSSPLNDKSPELYRDSPRNPHVFIVPSKSVKDASVYARKENWKRLFFWLPEGNGREYFENWTTIKEALTDKQSNSDC